MLMLALPERLSAPPAEGSRTKIVWPMVTVPAVPMLVRKLASPEYVALIVWEPAARLVVANVAVPDASATPPGVRSVLVVVSKKSTVPVGVPEPGALAATVAVNVTACPRFAKPGDAVAAVVVLSLLTTWLIDVEAAPALKLPSPLV